MGPLHFHGIARVVAVHGKGGDEDRAVDADHVHGRHHLVTGDVIGPIRDSVPGPFRSVRFIGVDLGVDDRHRDVPPCQASSSSPELVLLVLDGASIAWPIVSSALYLRGAVTPAGSGTCATFSVID